LVNIAVEEDFFENIWYDWENTKNNENTGGENDLFRYDQKSVESGLQDA